MTVTLKEMMASLSTKERKAVETRAADLIAEEMTLRDLRKALALTQETTSTVDNKIHFLLKNESNSFGSRVAGKPIRNKLLNLSRMGESIRIVIDLSDIPLISSSFADEAFAKLFLEVGAMEFMQKFEFINVMDTVQSLIDKAIGQRISAGVID